MEKIIVNVKLNNRKSGILMDANVLRDNIEKLISKKTRMLSLDMSGISYVSNSAIKQLSIFIKRKKLIFEIINSDKIKKQFYDHNRSFNSTYNEVETSNEIESLIKKMGI